jgi:hypothetical protein
MVDADLGWHLLLTTAGTELQRTIRIGPTVDLPDEVHPAYADDDMALARATAAIDGAAHYLDDVAVACPRGLGAGLGDVVSVPVDGTAVVGQVESVTWTATPDGTPDQVMIRRHVAIAPGAWVDPVIELPEVEDDAATTDSVTTASGNVLSNDDSGLTIVAVNGLSALVGVAVNGSNGGTFVVEADGSWTFDPDGAFDGVPVWSSETTSVVYYAFDGVSEAPGTLTVTVEAYNPPPIAVADSETTSAIKTVEGNVLTNDTDGNGDPLTVSAVNGTAVNVGATVPGSAGGMFTVVSNGAWAFDPNGDFDAITAVTDTWVDYTISDGHSTATARLTVSVTPSAAAIELVGTATGHAKNTNYTINLPAGVLPGDLVLVVTGCHSSGNLNPGIVSPAGYTELADLWADDSSDANLSINYKIMADPVDTSVTVSGSASSELGAATAIYVFRGVNQLDPLDVSIQTAVGANSAYADCPPITPVTDGALVVIFGAWTYQAATADTTVKAGEGWENFIAINSAVYYFSIQGCTKFWESGDGTIDPAAWTGQGTSTSRSWAAVSLALKPS